MLSVITRRSILERKRVNFLITVLMSLPPQNYVTVKLR